MNALVLTTSWPLRPGMLSGSFVRDLLRGLTRRGWTFEVVTPAPSGAVIVADDPGIRVHVVAHPGAGIAGGLAHGRGLPETLAEAPWTWLLVPPMLDAMARTADRLARRGGFDRVWSHWLLPSGWIGAGIARRAGVPHVITAHGSDIHRLERLAARPGMKNLLARAWRASTLTATSERAAARIAHALGGRPVQVCRLPAEAGNACPGDGAAHLLFLGRFEPIKGPDLLLEACARRSPAGELAHVTMAGDGSLAPQLHAQASRLPLPVSFPGVVTGTAKREALERSHALVVPSRRMRDGRTDGLPHAALEALAVGTPVIAPDEGPLGDLLRTTGAGIVYAPGIDDRQRVRNLSESLDRFAADPDQRDTLRRRAQAAGLRFQPRVALDAWQRALAEECA